jgi:hypothetical protein
MMSGGSFNYAFMAVDRFVEELNVKLDEKQDYFDHANTYQELCDILRSARLTAKLMKEVEWLYSGDTSEESFMQRVMEIRHEFSLDED